MRCSSPAPGAVYFVEDLASTCRAFSKLISVPGEPGLNQALITVLIESYRSGMVWRESMVNPGITEMPRKLDGLTAGEATS